MQPCQVCAVDGRDGVVRVSSSLFMSVRTKKLIAAGRSLFVCCLSQLVIDSIPMLLMLSILKTFIRCKTVGISKFIDICITIGIDVKYVVSLSHVRILYSAKDVEDWFGYGECYCHVSSSCLLNVNE